MLLDQFMQVMTAGTIFCFSHKKEASHSGTHKGNVSLHWCLANGSTPVEKKCFVFKTSFSRNRTKDTCASFT